MMQTQTGDSATKPVETLLLVAIIALGAFLRLHNLSGACMWIDEIVFANLSNPDSGIQSIWGQLYNEYYWRHHTPLPFVIEGAYVGAVQRLGLPLTETVYRTPAALMGIASIPILFLLARRMFGPRVGLVSAFLLSISFFHVYYSREAYVYSAFVLCALLSWYWLVRIFDEWKRGGRATIGNLAWYSVTTALTLQMVMAGILFVICEFLALVAAAWSSPLRHRTNLEKSKLLRPVVLAHVAAWIPFLPFLWKLAHYASADTSAVHPENIAPFLKMLGEMGWSSQPIPLALFLILVALGIGVGLRNSSWRDTTILTLLLGGFGAVGVAYLERLGRYESRYFIGLLPSLLILVAVTWVWLAEKASARLSTAVRWLVWVIPCAVLLVGHFAFYRQLYQLNAKALAGRQIASWIVQNTPERSVYVMDNAFVRRAVPDFYPTPGRYCASPAPHHSAEEHAAIGGFLQRVFRRFPDCYFVDTQRDLFYDDKGEPSDWLRTTFRRHVRIENPAFLRLFHMGIYPSGAFYPTMADPSFANMTTDIYYNTLEDLLSLHREVVIFGPEWVYSEAPLPQGGIDHWKALHSKGRVFIYGAGEGTVTVNVRMRCGSYRIGQSIVVELDGKQQEFDLRADGTEWLELGTMTVRPGQNQFVVRKKTPQLRSELPSLMVNEVRLVPVAPK